MFATTAQAGDCPDFDALGTDLQTASARLDEAEALYPTLYERVAELPDLAPWVIDGVNCLREPATPALAARYHRFRAVNADPLGGLGDTVRAHTVASLAAGWRLDSGYVATLPADHGHRAPVEVDATLESVPAPASGALFFDGAASEARPVGTATFFQRTDADGRVVDSAYLFPGEALPGYPQVLIEPPVEALEPLPEPLGPTRRSPKKALRYTGIGLGAVAAGLLTANVIGYQAALSDGGSRDDAFAAKPVVNGLGYGAIAAGAGSALLLTTSFVVK